ncbi:MAG TPA: DMT family transporter, partial [Symbiobacteriaceae bacterium]|nr:DMT family transporter [Symbiobacteriaceae bacterium]
MWTRLAGPLALAVASAIWGGTYVFAGWLLGGGWFTPFGLLFLRLLITFLILLPWLKERRLARAEWPAALGLGGVGFLLSLGAQFVGTAWAGSANGSLITATSPAFILLFGALLLGERLDRSRLIAIGLASAGVALVIGTGELWGGDGRAFWGKLLLASAGLTWGLYTVLAKRFAARHGALATTAWACLTGAGFNLPVALWRGRGALGAGAGNDTIWTGLWSSIGAPLGSWTPTVWLGLFYIAIVSTVVAFFLWNWGFARMEAGKGAIYFFLQPVIGSFLGWALLGE